MAMALAFTVGVTGCGNSSSDNPKENNDIPTYSGSTSPATISASNAEKIGTSATEGVVQAVETDANGDALPTILVATNENSTSNLNQKLRDITYRLLDSKRNTYLPLEVVLDGDDFPADMGYCGGSITFPDDMYNNTSGRLNGTITYNNFCTDAGDSYGRMTINGSLIFSETETHISMIYRNLIVSYNGETYTMNGTYTCNTSFTNCTMSSDYAGSDGSTYRMSDVSVSGNNSSGYSVNASFCHPNYGCVTIETTTPITFNCANGMADGGAIRFTGANSSSGTISFDSCSSYSGTYNDGSGSITSFSGNWPT